METTSELITRLYQHSEDYAQGYTQNFYTICYDCKKAADRLCELQQFVDDMLGDHYVDYLEFYTNRCRELEDHLEALRCLVENNIPEGEIYL